ncbi:MAG TPA: L,D-transpeptidase family protein [Anaerolineales bacterium]|nr:L,D-transpeptidase family protein [Anaerolineales bacterium]
MNDSEFLESRKAIQNAREALQRGDRSEARHWAEEAARLAPKSEDPWLILAAVASPRSSVEYIQKALAINPDSPRAQKGMQWAMKRLQETPEAGTPSINAAPAEGSARSVDSPTTTARKRSPIFPILLFVLGCIAIGFAAWSASTSPVLASILSLGGATQPAQTDQPQTWAHAQIAKPTYTATPEELIAAVEEPSATPIEEATQQPTEALPTLPAETATPFPTEDAALQPSATPAVTDTPAATETPGVLMASIVQDTPTPEYAPSTAAAADQSSDSQPQVSVGDGEHWIDVDLTHQRVYAYAGDTVVNTFIVSTGTWQYPTVTGQYHIYIKLLSTTMTGPGYYLPNVPYTMYFYKGYGLHGTYWHHNFGTPMSHGCVNLSIPDAEWLYNFSSVGTLVNVHY